MSGHDKRLMVIYSCMLCLGIVVGSVLFPDVGNKEYKRGYIDAATGKAGYDLVTHDDGSRSWEKSTTLKGQRDNKETNQ